jgi:hypothetical protein
MISIHAVAMEFLMKVFITGLTAIITGLFLILGTSCQKTNKGESKSHWQLSAPPGLAAGYGSAPLDTSATKDVHETSTVDQSNKSGQGEETAPAASEPEPRQPATETGPPASSWKIEPPPSAAGYGK